MNFQLPMFTYGVIQPQTNMETSTNAQRRPSGFSGALLSKYLWKFCSRLKYQSHLSKKHYRNSATNINIKIIIHRILIMNSYWNESWGFQVVLIEVGLCSGNLPICLIVLFSARGIKKWWYQTFHNVKF